MKQLPLKISLQPPTKFEELFQLISIVHRTFDNWDKFPPLDDAENVCEEMEKRFFAASTTQMEQEKVNAALVLELNGHQVGPEEVVAYESIKQEDGKKIIEHIAENHIRVILQSGARECATTGQAMESLKNPYAATLAKQATKVYSFNMLHASYVVMFFEPKVEKGVGAGGGAAKVPFPFRQLNTQVGANVTLNLLPEEQKPIFLSTRAAQKSSKIYFQVAVYAKAIRELKPMGGKKTRKDLMLEVVKTSLSNKVDDKKVTLTTTWTKNDFDRGQPEKGRQLNTVLLRDIAAQNQSQGKVCMVPFKLEGDPDDIAQLPISELRTALNTAFLGCLMWTDADLTLLGAHRCGVNVMTDDLRTLEKVTSEMQGVHCVVFKHTMMSVRYSYSLIAATVIFDHNITEEERDALRDEIPTPLNREGKGNVYTTLLPINLVVQSASPQAADSNNVVESAKLVAGSQPPVNEDHHRCALLLIEKPESYKNSVTKNNTSFSRVWPVKQLAPSKLHNFIQAQWVVLKCHQTNDLFRAKANCYLTLDLPGDEGAAYAFVHCCKLFPATSESGSSQVIG